MRGMHSPCPKLARPQELTSIEPRSKFALEGYTESLAKEVHPDWNIKFLIVELGGVKTNYIAGLHHGPSHPAYQDPSCPYNQLKAYIADESVAEQWADPAACARAMFDIASSRNRTSIPRRLILGADAVQMLETEIQESLKELEAWKAVSQSCSPTAKGEAI